MDTNQTCGCCGKTHSHTPQDARQGDQAQDQFPGLYWECQCGSTLYTPSSDMKRLIEYKRVLRNLLAA